jgi:hypothetical protein
VHEGAGLPARDKLQHNCYLLRLDDAIRLDGQAEPFYLLELVDMPIGLLRPGVTPLELGISYSDKTTMGRLLVEKACMVD